MKIAFIGSRGIPAHYSGVETGVENIALRLAARGHEVVVYCRPHMITWKAPIYHGVRLVKLPTIRSKFLDTFVHTGLSTLHTLLIVRPDVAIYVIAGNSPWVLCARLLGIRCLHNVDGLDSERAKWGRKARLYLRFSEWLSSWAANVTITDARTMQRLYQQRFGRESTYIPYGAELPAPRSQQLLKHFGLTANGYLLFVGRLVPENGAHVLLAAYAELATELPLVIVGDAPYEGAYVQELQRTASNRVIFTGAIYGDGYRQLLHNAHLFVFCSEVGGTHPVLIEAMAAGACIVANDHLPNCEVLGESGRTYHGPDGAPALAAALRALLADADSQRALREAAADRARELYSWPVVTDQYETLCLAQARRRSPG